MIRNMGTADRAIRIIVALVIAALYFGGRIHGTLAIVLGIVAVVFLVTSLAGWCPSYIPLKISTLKPPAGPKSTI
jgi:K+-transporting ATPase A subunit